MKIDVDDPENAVDFHGQFVVEIVNGEKTATVRPEYYWDPRQGERSGRRTFPKQGETTIAKDHNGDPFAVIRITHSAVGPLSDAVDLIDAWELSHGTDTAGELANALGTHYSRKFRGDETVRVLGFEVVEVAGDGD